MTFLFSEEGGEKYARRREAIGPNEPLKLIHYQNDCPGLFPKINCKEGMKKKDIKIPYIIGFTAFDEACSTKKQLSVTPRRSSQSWTGENSRSARWNDGVALREGRTGIMIEEKRIAGTEKNAVFMP